MLKTALFPVNTVIVVIFTLSLTGLNYLNYFPSFLLCLWKHVWQLKVPMYSVFLPGLKVGKVLIWEGHFYVRSIILRHFYA